MIWVLEIKCKRNTFATHLDVDLVETIEVKLNRLIVESHLTWVEQDRYLELLFGHQYLSWNHVEVKMELLLKVRLERDGLLVLVSDFKDLLYWGSIRGNKAWTEVKNAGIEFYSRLSCLSRQHEVVSWSRNNRQSALVIGEVVLCDRQVVYLDGHFRSLLNGASIRSDGNILVDLALPDKVEVELTVVRQSDTLGLLLIDEEIAKVEFVRLR